MKKTIFAFALVAALTISCNGNSTKDSVNTDSTTVVMDSDSIVSDSVTTDSVE